MLYSTHTFMFCTCLVQVGAYFLSDMGFFLPKIIPCTRRQCIVFLSSLIVLFEGNLLEWGQLFSTEILWCGGNCPGDSFPWGQLSGGQLSRGQSSRRQLSGGQLSGGGGQLSGHHEPLLY